MKIHNTRNFTNGFVWSLETTDGKKVEATSTCLPKSTEVRLTHNQSNRADVNTYSPMFWKEKWAIGVSTQTGCPIRCKFCAVNELTKKQGWRNLTTSEILEQVAIMVCETDRRGFISHPSEAEIFRILFTRMGEPSLNIENVINAIRVLKQKYTNTRIQISTIGTTKSKELVAQLMKLEDEFGSDWLELQFSIHSTNNNYRRWLQSPAVLTNEEINELASMYYNAKPNRPWKVTLNFALSKESPFDVESLKRQFDPNCCFIKVSPINENVVSDSSGLKSLFHYENSF